MTEANVASAEWQVVGREDFSGSWEDLGTFELTLVALRNVKSGEIRIDVSIPNADHLVLSRDLSVVLHCFGWGMVCLGEQLRRSPVEVLQGICGTMQKVDYTLKYGL